MHFGQFSFSNSIHVFRSINRTSIGFGQGILVSGGIARVLFLVEDWTLKFKAEGRALAREIVQTGSYA